MSDPKKITDAFQEECLEICNHDCDTCADRFDCNDSPYYVWREMDGGFD